MMRKTSGLTVLELVFSVGLVFILAAVAFWAVNPLERFKQNRDRERMADFEAIRAAIDSQISAGQILGTTFGIPSNTAGVGVSFKTDGSGWVPMILPGLSELPRDPRNGEQFPDVLKSAVLGEYQYVSDGKYFILRTHLEAEIYRDRYAQDGNDNTWYEIGNAAGMSTYFGL